MYRPILADTGQVSSSLHTNRCHDWFCFERSVKACLLVQKSYAIVVLGRIRILNLTLEKMSYHIYSSPAQKENAYMLINLTEHDHNDCIKWQLFTQHSNDKVGPTWLPMNTLHSTKFYRSTPGPINWKNLIGQQVFGPSMLHNIHQTLGLLTNTG